MPADGLDALDDRAIGRWRLHTQHLAGRTFADPTEAVGGMLCVQAENFAQASWALAERTAGALVEEDVTSRYDAGRILRTHVLRPTWHFVLPDDIAWLLELTAPRIRRSYAAMRREHGLDETVVGRGVEALAAALEGRHRTRAELAARLNAEGLPSTGMPLGIILGEAELAGVICSGRRAQGEHTFALLAERAPRARRLGREAALAELVLRYVRSHGPATERDLAYWATLTATDVRAGLRMVADEVDAFERDGRTYWFTDPPPAAQTLEPRGHLLQTLDEYHNGYQDSRYSLDADGLVPRGRLATVGMALVDGQMVGGMRRTVTAAGVRFEVSLLRRLAADEVAALEAAARRYGAFLQREPDLRLTDA